MVGAEADNIQDVSTFNIAIVGLGPKGFYAFERLVAQLNAGAIQHPVAIYLFNQNPFFAAGNVYRPDQASYLLMNYANKNINCWTDEPPSSVLDSRHDFVSWLKNINESPTAVKEDGFASRAMVGSYLMEGFSDLCHHLPENIQVVKHISTVTGIEKKGDNYRLFTEGEAQNKLPAFNKVLLTTGHLGCGAGFLENKKKGRFIDFIYPTDLALASIEMGAKVAVKGFGLTSIDAILALTEGRGGKFKSEDSGKLTYITSGKEPGKIYPYSRTGLPMMPRTGTEEDKLPLGFFTKENIASLISEKPASFEKNLLPLLIKEFTYSYYRLLFKKYRWRLLYYSEFERISEQIEPFHKAYPQAERFNWEKLVDPFAGQSALSHSVLLNYMEILLMEAEKGPEKSPLSAVLGRWRKISDIFNEIYSFGGLDADSHRLFDGYYFNLFNRMAYGPPVKNFKKLLALSEAGLVDLNFVRGTEFVVDKGSGTYGFLRTENKRELAIDYLINARIPRNNERVVAGTLYHSILQNGLGRKFTNSSGGTYTPGCMDINKQGQIIAKEGSVQEGIALYGTPTEGLTLDNDTLSRKRNNFASHWAEEVALAVKLNESVNNCIENET
ncbi:FAD/NAD(P)-binding protein [uncultured Cyclobacterium sp.]|uniref:FAD/NAD(P)-binding protein n=1 Tax=uncultured Cyclobacterium sp. TaxID=453820 RepID=UPI0030EC991F|tara:strand:- start:2397 stop:4232 length:1836 start_codon:yes stop_codon:yes gene_type:complete